MHGHAWTSKVLQRENDWVDKVRHKLYLLYNYISMKSQKGKSNLWLKISSDWLGIGKGCFSGKENEGTSGVM